MNKIITIAPQPGSPLAPLDVFGHVHSGERSLKIALIESVELHESGDVRVTMASGTKHEFTDGAGQKFLADINAVVAAILQQMQQPQILGVPPGTQLRPH